MATIREIRRQNTIDAPRTLYGFGKPITDVPSTFSTQSLRVCHECGSLKTAWLVRQKDLAVLGGLLMYKDSISGWLKMKIPDEWGALMRVETIARFTLLAGLLADSPRCLGAVRNRR
jgi:hypothetical protein